VLIIKAILGKENRRGNPEMYRHFTEYVFLRASTSSGTTSLAWPSNHFSSFQAVVDYSAGSWQRSDEKESDFISALLLLAGQAEQR
jgi:hypothetical protein